MFLGGFDHRWIYTTWGWSNLPSMWVWWTFLCTHTYSQVYRENGRVLEVFGSERKIEWFLVRENGLRPRLRRERERREVRWHCMDVHHAISRWHPHKFPIISNFCFYFLHHSYLFSSSFFFINIGLFGLRREERNHLGPILEFMKPKNTFSAHWGKWNLLWPNKAN